jgi:hypothetical protein
METGALQPGEEPTFGQMIAPSSTLRTDSPQALPGPQRLSLRPSDPPIGG